METTVPEIISALGWPHFAFAFGLVFLFIFREQLRALLGRITSIDKSGIKTQPNPEIQREDPKKIEAAQELLLAIGNTVVLQDIESRIKNELTSRQLSIDSETTKVLIKYLAAAQVGLEFEQVQNLIFGSQIFLLKKLNEVSGQGQSPALVQSHFEHIQKVFSDSFADWSLEKYLHFLFERNLVIFQDGRYHITNLGKEYLVWMARTGRSENKPL
jgi:hypothetical protein